MKISNLKLSSKDDTKPAVKRLVSDSTQKESSIPVLPPDYLEATQVYDEHNTDQSPNIIAGPHPRLTRPTNYLTLIREDSPIRGTFKVDPTLAIPPGAIISKDRHGKELNLKFGSTCGMVEVYVEIVRGIVTPMHMGPARLEVASIHCDVIATIHDRRQNRFRLTAISQNGNIALYIPPTFTGSIVGKLNRGTIKFGNEVQPQLTVLSEQNKESRYFIGDYLRTGYRDDESWTMDHLYLESNGANATVVVDFVPPESSSGPPVIPSRGARGSSRARAKKPRQKGFIRRLFS